jgi:predicted lipoprotein with Yx(FWY)xxD motif
MRQIQAGPARRVCRALVVVLGAVGAGGLVAACSAGPTGTFYSPTATTAVSKLLHGPVDELTVHQVSGLGSVVVNGQGLTLYVYAPDRGLGRSTCYNVCSVEWPPLLVTGGDRPVAGPGTVASLIGTTVRSDHTIQITYDRWPLYLWPPDGAPGQATGQAINNAGGYWYAIRPDGTVVTTRLP